MRWQRGGNVGGCGNDAAASDGNDDEAVEVDNYEAIDIRYDGAAAAAEVEAKAKVVETVPVEATGAAPDAKGGRWEVISVDGKDEDSGTDARGNKPWLCCLCFEEFFLGAGTKLKKTHFPFTEFRAKKTAIFHREVLQKVL